MRILSLAALLALPATLVAQQAGAPDLSSQPTLYAVGYAHLDTEWRWEYPQVIDEYLRKTLEDNFKLLDKYPHYVFNFSGANRYRLMKEYFPEDFARMKQYVAQGRWFPAGSSMEEGDVNTPSPEAIFRQFLYGNEWFQRELGKTSAEYMIPDCFGFPSSLPTLLAAAGIKGFSTQKLSWGSSAYAGGPESLENTPEGTPFNVGVWVGPDGKSVIAALNPGAYNGGIYTDLSTPLSPLPPSPLSADLSKQLADMRGQMPASARHQPPTKVDPALVQKWWTLRAEQQSLEMGQGELERDRFQGDWAARVLNNGKVTGVMADYHYYGTGDIGGAPREEDVKRLEAIVTGGSTDVAPPDAVSYHAPRGEQITWPDRSVGHGPVHVVSATADQLFLDVTPQQREKLPRYTGEMELTNHSAGSLTSQAYQKRWIRQEEIVADEAEKASVAAQWLGARTYPMQRLNDAWTLAMGAHFHDLAAGTATPRSYEFAWNDDAIALNQFSGIFKSATEGVAAALDTSGDGIPVVVFNPLGIEREDIVTADVTFPGGTKPAGVRVTGPDGAEVPAQLTEDGKVLFSAHLPSVGYAVFHVSPGAAAASGSSLKVSQSELENDHYKVTLNSDGDVSSIYDKDAKHELLREPARLSLNYDNPVQWPAWNMDWDQEQAAPKGYVSGPAKIRVVENGPARVAVEIVRDTAGSHFVQTVRLSTGDAGRRVEWANSVDWNTKERNLKASFALTASNQIATYNWGVGTIERTTAEPKKFEVPSHQWVDLTDASDEWGTTMLTDNKTGSDKPNDHTLRLTLIRTPGVAGGYTDEASQDIGHHDFLYGIAGHAKGWRQGQTDWQGERLNTQPVAFTTAAHPGALGKSFSLVKVSDPRIRVMAVKKAEMSDEVVIRLVEMDGKPAPEVHINFAAPITAARELNAQEKPLDDATVAMADGGMTTSFSAYQPRTFAVKLGAAPTTVPGVQSAPVSLHYDLATATADKQASKAGIDGKGDALPAAMLPEQIEFHGVTFHMGPATGANAIVAKGQRIALPGGNYNRVYLIAASAEGDQTATFTAGSAKAELNVENWTGFIGQWYDRQWSVNDFANDKYGDMTGLKPAFLKRADLAWYASHHHDASGTNIPYAYSYLFAYGMDLPAGTKTLQLPNNPKIRIFAVSVAQEGEAAKPAQPLYDVLPSPMAKDSAQYLPAPAAGSPAPAMAMTPKKGQ